MEVAALGLKVEGIEGIDRAAASLDGLSTAAVKAEKATKGVGSGSSSAKTGIDASAAAAAKAAQEQAKLAAAAERAAQEQARLAAEAERAAQAEARFAAQAARAGMSVNAMNASLRGVPAQFTDIAVSLQGGMNPLTVFLQQGGQLKDMFGGAGNAARALGGYVVGLINPFTIAAAAIGAIGVAYNQGSKEADAFRVSLATTGNSAGLTTGALQSYAKQISETTGTQGKAAESLNVFVAAGVRAGEQLAQFTETAIRWEKATGEGVDSVAEKFVSLQGDPLKAAMKLNEGMNFLTLSTYEQIKALEEQGKTTEAAEVAMNALDAAMADRAKNIDQNLGSIERAWGGITGAAKRAWDAMLNVGRPASISDQLSAVDKELERVMAQQGFAETGGGAATGRVSGAQQAQVKESIRLLQEQKFALMDKADAEIIGALATEQSAKAVANKAAWDKITNGNLDKSTKMERELTNVRNAALAVGIEGQALENQLSAVREKYADKTKKSNSSIKAAKTAYETLIVSINEKIAATNAELATSEKQSEADKLRTRYQQELTTRSREFTKAQREKIEADLAAYDALEKQLVIQRALEKAWEDDAKALDSYTKKQEDALNTVSQSIDKLLLEEEAHVLAAKAGISHGEALAQLTIARLEEARAQMLQGAGSADEIERINLEIAARKNLLGVMGSAVVREANEKASKDALKEWEKTSEMVGDTLADYIMGGGQDAAQYLKRLFSTLVLQPVVQTLVGGIMGSGPAGAATGGASSLIQGGMNALSTGKSIVSAINGGFEAFGGQVANYVQSAMNLASGSGGIISQGPLQLSQFAQGAGAAAGIAGGVAGGIYGGRMISGGYSALGGASGNSAVNIGTAIGTAVAGPLGSLVGGILGGVTNRLFGRKLKDQGIQGEFGGDESFTGESYRFLKGGLFRSDKTETSALDDEMRQALADQFSLIKLSTSAMSDVLGLSTDAIDNFTSSIKVSFKDLSDDEAQKALTEEFNKVAESLASAALGTTAYSKAGETAIEAITRLSGSLTSVNSIFDQLNFTLFDSTLAGADLSSKFVDLFGGMENLASASNSYYQSFFSNEERAQALREQQIKSLGDAGLYIDPGQGNAAKEMFRKTVEEAMASGQSELAAKLLMMNQSFSESAGYWQQELENSAAERLKAIEKSAEEELQALEKAESERMQAAEEAARMAKQVADERYSLETSLLQLVGETDELRARELNTLDASNHELQKLIWARQDEADAAKVMADEAIRAAQKMADTQKAMQSVSSGFAGLRETVMLDQLGTDDAKYAYFKAQADSLTRMLPQLEDQEAITRAVNEIQSFTSRAYGTLDAEQKVEMGDEFLRYLSQTEDLALKNIERANQNLAESTGKAVGDAVAKEVGRIVSAIASIASDSGQISRETIEAIRRLSSQTGETVTGTRQKYAEVNA